MTTVSSEFHFICKGLIELVVGEEFKGTAFQSLVDKFAFNGFDSALMITKIKLKLDSGCKLSILVKVIMMTLMRGTNMKACIDNSKLEAQEKKDLQDGLRDWGISLKDKDTTPRKPASDEITPGRLVSVFHAIAYSLFKKLKDNVHFPIEVEELVGAPKIYSIFRFQFLPGVIAWDGEKPKTFREDICFALHVCYNVLMTRKVTKKSSTKKFSNALVTEAEKYGVASKANPTVNPIEDSQLMDPKLYGITSDRFEEIRTVLHNFKNMVDGANVIKPAKTYTVSLLISDTEVIPLTMDDFKSKCLSFYADDDN